MVNLLSNKNVFWQAFLVAFVIFWTGIILGIMFEDFRNQKAEKLFYDTETEIFDIQLQGDILLSSEFSCETVIRESILFADRIFKEARELEKYDASNKITGEALRLHRRYDLLRTMLWNNLIESEEKCGEQVNVVVFLYNYNNPAPPSQALQLTIGKVLLELKEEYGDEIILIPIAADMDVMSLALLQDKYKVSSVPIVIINQEHLLTGLITKKQVEQYLKSNKNSVISPDAISLN